jgi:hypothetical protein
VKLLVISVVSAWFAARALSCAAPDWNAVEGSAADAAKCQTEARAAYAGCLDAGVRADCNQAARDAYEACKTRVGAP